MRWSTALFLGSALGACTSGCRNCDNVESELRAREVDVRELREEVHRLEWYNQSMQRELCAARGEPVPPPGPTGVVEKPVESYPVRSLVLGRQTSGQPSTTLPADDVLQVLVEPRDPEGQAIKVPGFLFIEVQEITKEGLKRPLSTWEISPDDLRRSWRNGLLTTGYVIMLPWKVWPSTPNLRVIARFRLFDGRTFEADRDITVRVLPAEKRSLVPPPPQPAPKQSGPRLPFPTPDPLGAPQKPPARLPAPTPDTQQGIPLPKIEGPTRPAPTPPPSSDSPTPVPGPTLPPPRPQGPVLPPPRQEGPALTREAAPTVVPASGTGPDFEILRPVPFGQIKD